MKTGDDIDKAEIVHQNHTIKTICYQISRMHTSDKYSTGIMQQLPEEFEYAALKIGCLALSIKNKSRQENGT
jgi:hypothetical protein